MTKIETLWATHRKAFVRWDRASWGRVLWSTTPWSCWRWSVRRQKLSVVHQTRETLQTIREQHMSTMNYGHLVTGSIGHREQWLGHLVTGDQLTRWSNNLTRTIYYYTPTFVAFVHNLRDYLQDVYATFSFYAILQCALLHVFRVSSKTALQH